MQSDSRWLSIGEFAAATQLSAKALRLYDEQRLLVPAKIDSANGYRLYRGDQVALGRLIRTLRDMNVSLNDIGRFVRAPEASSTLLGEFARAIDRRYAREKRAYQSALTLLDRAQPSTELPVSRRSRPGMSVVALSCLTTRARFFECIRDAVTALKADTERNSISNKGTAFVDLVDPLSDDEGRVEVLLPVEASEQSSRMSLRHAPATNCAVFDSPGELIDVGAAQDVIFDWFDRHGLRALGTPWLAVEIEPLRVVELQWAFEERPT